MVQSDWLPQVSSCLHHRSILTSFCIALLLAYFSGMAAMWRSRRRIEERVIRDTDAHYRALYPIPTLMREPTPSPIPAELPAVQKPLVFDRPTVKVADKPTVKMSPPLLAPDGERENDPEEETLEAGAISPFKMPITLPPPDEEALDSGTHASADVERDVERTITGGVTYNDIVRNCRKT
jgi:hypothetical protein